MVAPENSEEGNLLGHFCGDTLPLSNITADGKLWVKFNSDQQSVSRGFTAFYSIGKSTYISKTCSLLQLHTD